MNEAQHDYWSGDVGRVWAEEQAALDAWLGAVDAPLLAAAVPRAGEHVLDVGCGAGATSMALADAVTPDGTVTGVDLSPQLLARARERAEGRPGLRFLEADAQTGAIGEGYDLIVSRFGVMFFADPVAAFARMRAACRPGARLAFACWRAAADNPAFAVPIAAVAPLLTPGVTTDRYATTPTADPHSPGPLAFADSERTLRLITEAGWRDAAAVAGEVNTVVGRGDTALADAVRLLARIGPAAAAVKELGKEARPIIRERLASALAPWQQGTLVQLPAGIWIVTAVA